MVETVPSVSSSKQVSPIRDDRPNNRDLYREFPGFSRLPSLTWAERGGGSKSKETSLC